MDVSGCLRYFRCTKVPEWFEIYLLNYSKDERGRLITLSSMGTTPFYISQRATFMTQGHLHKRRGADDFSSTTCDRKKEPAPTFSEMCVREAGVQTTLRTHRGS